MEPLPLKQFLKNLKVLREQKDFASRAALGDAAGIPRSRWDSYFKKNRESYPAADDVYRIANKLNKTMEELVTGEIPSIKTGNPRIDRICDDVINMSENELDSIIEFIQFQKYRNNNRNTPQEAPDTPDVPNSSPKSGEGSAAAGL